MRWEDWNRLLKPISTRQPSWRTFSWAARKLSIVWYSNFLIPQPLCLAQLECPLYGVHFSEKGNDLTNTLKIQRIPINLTLTLAKVTTKTVKRTKPRRRIACSGVHLCAETAEKPDSKRFSGIEKVHRNSIKITVDLWSEWLDSNQRPLEPHSSAIPNFATPGFHFA